MSWSQSVTVAWLLVEEYTLLTCYTDALLMCSCVGMWVLVLLLLSLMRDSSNPRGLILGPHQVEVCGRRDQ